MKILMCPIQAEEKGLFFEGFAASEGGRQRPPMLCDGPNLCIGWAEEKEREESRGVAMTHLCTLTCRVRVLSVRFANT